MATTERTVVERFVAALAARDRAAAMTLYAPEAHFEAHVPDWDPIAEGPAAIGELLQGFFIGRDGFRVARSEILAEGPAAALNFDLEWCAADDGAPCLCFQSHAFTIAAGQIQRHRMYCAGVRVFRDLV
jgi:ketosteroid isomerase-like protein